MSPPANQKQLQPWHKTPAEEDCIRATEATLAWLAGLTGAELRALSGKWIAAQECQVVAAADTFDELMNRVEQRDLHRLVIHRVEKPQWTVRGHS